nr:MAG TPA: hypothetical protein [Inoviridae sp.]
MSKDAKLWKVNHCRYANIFVFHRCWTLVFILYC